MPPARTRAPLPRITDPYWPWEEPENDSEIMAVEKVRVAHNSRVCRLKKIYEKAASSNSAKAEAAQRKYEVEELRYERIYGNALGSMNCWWQGRRQLMPPVMMSRACSGYLTLATEFETDFGHQFSAKDGTDHHFDRMAFHAAQANGSK
ncbi:hypothetical protein C8R43DRAFT_1142703 [Mycena crocata]|nr:hypothetical protein C8R43DRAFT_1142703 [Mycena crocata]